jgi:type II restriction enzyme
MKKICQISKFNEDDTFKLISSNLKDQITQWDYFVNWKKVLSNIEPIEKELNLLNFIIGKKNLLKEVESLVLKYPNIVKAIPTLLAIREKSIKVLIDISNFIYKYFDFSQKNPSAEDARNFAEFVIESGLGQLVKDSKIKNFVDYVIGVEVGLDSNARKNRTGSLMESIVETFVAKACKTLKITYLHPATAQNLKTEWNINLKEDESSRIIDFAINKNGKIFFIETNFYGGGGSKLKSTANEYIRMSKFWNEQGIEFIWITDGNGWKNTLKPLREYFDNSDFLLNLEMLKNRYLVAILKQF